MSPPNTPMPPRGGSSPVPPPGPHERGFSLGTGTDATHSGNTATGTIVSTNPITGSVRFGPDRLSLSGRTSSSTLPPIAPSNSAQRPLPFMPLAPAIVVVLALAIAFAIGFTGVDHLARASDAHAAMQADLLAAAVGARLSKLPPNERLDAMQLAARRTGSEFLVVTADGELLADASLGAPDRGALRRVLEKQRGEAVTALGRTRFSVKALTGEARLLAAPANAQTPGQALASRASPLGSTAYLIAFARMPSVPEAAPALLTGLIALTILLVGVAAIVAYAVALDADRDVGFVTGRVAGMTQVRSEPTGEPVPVRTMDEVGALTSAFNELVGRFAAAEKSYREDLERVRSADRDRSAFLAAVSHELRSPLNAILGFADILMTEVDGPMSESAREEVEQIRGSGQHLLELINDILEFSALEGGQLRLSRGRVDLALLVADVMREAAALVGDKPVALRGEARPDVLAFADPKRVRQIVTNLVSNAVKFTQRGEVYVTVARHGSYARVSVRDTGPGINATERAMIFEDYKQAGDERKRKRGTGLGLAIARRLVLMHGGSIQVESELGKGSTFHVFFPLYFDQDTKAKRRKSRASESRISVSIRGGSRPSGGHL